MLPLRTEYLDSIGHGGIDAAFAIDRQAIRLTVGTGLPTRGHSFVLCKVTAVRQAAIGLNVECQQILASGIVDVEHTFIAAQLDSIWPFNSFDNAHDLSTGRNV